MDDISTNRSQNIEGLLGYTRGSILRHAGACKACEGNKKPLVGLYCC